jgi:hypothetical protein
VRRQVSYHGSFQSNFLARLRPTLRTSPALGLHPSGQSTWGLADTTVPNHLRVRRTALRMYPQQATSALIEADAKRTV